MGGGGGGVHLDVVGFLVPFLAHCGHFELLDDFDLIVAPSFVDIFLPSRSG